MVRGRKVGREQEQEREKGGTDPRTHLCVPLQGGPVTDRNKWNRVLFAGLTSARVRHDDSRGGRRGGALKGREGGREGGHLRSLKTPT